MFASISQSPRKITPVYKAVLLAALCTPVWVHAADQGAATGDGALEEVVVTALKRDTKLQDTPVSITALNERAIERMAASNLVDIIRSVPSLQLSGDYGQRIVLRGVQAAGEPVVGLYYGETPLVGPSGSTADAGLHTPDLNLFDIERVEVLRGPQGTLYGAGSVGGTLRLLFNQPNATRYEGKVECQVSTTEGGEVGWYTKIASNVPLIENTLAARVVLYKQERGGFTDDTLYGRHNVNGSDAEGGSPDRGAGADSGHHRERDGRHPKDGT
jgi:iron complex outermembrane recepter protein